ncbi:MAG: Crp/Fnr family transcriptional regulator [Chloracidobacterium sp.]|nr:Crp/Fnr family transcriptional regulator [Chloracidobacterium sp.]
MSRTISVFIEQVSLTRQALPIVPSRCGASEYILSQELSGAGSITFPAGTAIFGPQNRDTSTWLLLSGTARLVRCDGPGTVRSSVLIHRGEFVGLTETLASIPHPDNLEAISPCVFQRMDVDDLVNWLKCMPDVGLELLRSVAADLSTAHFRSVKVLMCDHYHRRKVNQDIGLS